MRQNDLLLLNSKYSRKFEASKNPSTITSQSAQTQNKTTKQYRKEESGDSRFSFFTTSNEPSIWKNVFYRFPFINWRFFLPEQHRLCLARENKLDEQKDSEHEYDPYFISEDARQFNVCRSLIISSFVISSLGVLAISTWSQVLVIDPFSKFEVAVLMLLSGPGNLMLNLILVKFGVYSPDLGGTFHLMVVTFKVTLVTLLSGGTKSPALITLYTLIPCFCSCYSITSATYLGGFVLFLVSILSVCPELNVSFLPEAASAATTLNENIVSWGVQMLSVFVTRMNINRDRKAVEKSVSHAINADKIKSFFLASTSHEMRTPLHHIHLLNQLMSESLDKSLEEEPTLGAIELLHETLSDYVKQCKTATTLLLSLIDDALDLSKIQAGGLTVSNGHTCLVGCVDETYNMFKHKAQEKNIYFSLEITDNVQNKYVFADTLRVTQIITNFLGNAFKFTASHGKIKLSLSVRKMIKECPV